MDLSSLLAKLHAKKAYFIRDPRKTYQQMYCISAFEHLQKITCFVPVYTQPVTGAFLNSRSMQQML